MNAERLLYNIALASLTKEAMLPSIAMGLGGIGRGLAGLRQQQQLPGRIAEFHARAQALHPADREGAHALLKEFNDLPHAAYAQALGVPRSHLLRQLAPGLVHGPLLAQGGAQIGGALGGPLGAGVGAILGGVGSAFLNKRHNRDLNDMALRRAMGPGPGGA